MARWLKRLSSGLRLAAAPDGSTRAPAIQANEAEHFPASIEDPDLATAIDWPWVADVLDAGLCVAVAIAPEDIEALRCAAMQRVGGELVMRETEPGLLWVVNASALRWPEEE